MHLYKWMEHFLEESAPLMLMSWQRSVINEWTDGALSNSIHTTKYDSHDTKSELTLSYLPRVVIKLTCHGMGGK